MVITVLGGKGSHIRAINTRFTISWGIAHRVSGDPKRIVLGRTLDWTAERNSVILNQEDARGGETPPCRAA